jgi:hypothetical protein
MLHILEWLTNRNRPVWIQRYKINGLDFFFTLHTQITHHEIVAELVSYNNRMTVYTYKYNTAVETHADALRSAQAEVLISLMDLSRAIQKNASLRLTIPPESI